MKIQPTIDYKNFRMAQHPHALSVFREMLNTIKPVRILEIGTAKGGFVVALKDIVDELKLSTTIRSYDIINNEKLYEDIRLMGIDQRVENIFDSSYTDLDPTKKEEIVSFIQSEGITLILCDGGNKINEFNCFAKYLKSNDIIMAHDYAESLLYYHQHIRYKKWNWIEILGKDIENSCRTYNLTDYMKENFQSVVWCCKQKQ